MQDVAADSVVQRLMPKTVAAWDGDQTDYDLDDLRAEDVAYGDYLLAAGMNLPGMFHRRCTAAAIKQRKQVQTLCEAIANFDLTAFVERLEQWQTR